MATVEGRAAARAVRVLMFVLNFLQRCDLKTKRFSTRSYIYE